jgi:hypothetical protein
MTTAQNLSGACSFRFQSYNQWISDATHVEVWMEIYSKLVLCEILLICWQLKQDDSEDFWNFIWQI